MNTARPWNQLRALWEGAGRIPRLLSVLGVLLVVGLGLSAGGEGSGDEYCQLCGPIDDRARLMSIAEDLDKNGIHYRIGSGGALEVPQEELSRAISSVVQTSQASGRDEAEIGGLFSGGMGFTSTRARRDAQLRQREADIARTITMYDAVRQARVHISRPDERLFSPRGKDTRASVFLQLVPDRQLSRCQVQAIRDLVVNGVQGLLPESVTISDATGSDYAALLRADTPTVASRELELQGRIEGLLAEKIRGHLTCLFGPESVTVAVTARVDLSAVPVDEAPAAEVASDGEGASGGASVRMVALASSGSLRVGRSVTARRPAPRRSPARSILDAVSGLCVAVFIDSAFFEGAAIPENLRSAVVESIRTVARLDEARGDRVSVLTVPFSRGGSHDRGLVPRAAVPAAPLSSASEVDEAAAASTPLASTGWLADGEAPVGTLPPLLVLAAVGALMTLVVFRRRVRSRQLVEDAAALSGVFNVGLHGGAVDSFYDWDDPASREALVRGTAEGEPAVIARLIRTIRLDNDGGW